MNIYFFYDLGPLTLNLSVNSLIHTHLMHALPQQHIYFSDQSNIYELKFTFHKFGWYNYSKRRTKFWSNWKLHHCLWVLWFFFLLSVRNFSRVMHEATYRFNEIIVHFDIAGLYISNCVRIKETEYISYIYKTIHHGHRDTWKIICYT